MTLLLWWCNVGLVSLAGDQIVSPSSSVPRLVRLWHGATVAAVAGLLPPPTGVYVRACSLYSFSCAL